MLSICVMFWATKKGICSLFSPFTNSSGLLTYGYLISNLLHYYFTAKTQSRPNAIFSCKDINEWKYNYFMIIVISAYVTFIGTRYLFSPLFLRELIADWDLYTHHFIALQTYASFLIFSIHRKAHSEFKILIRTWIPKRS